MTRHLRIASAPRRIARSLRTQLGRQDGIALPTAVILLMVVSTLGTLAIKQAIGTESQSQRDRNVKNAIDAADAGFDTAVYRYNKQRPAPNQCVLVNASSQSLSNGSANADGWCPAVTEDLGGGASFTYLVNRAVTVSNNGQAMLQRKIVSTGAITFGSNREVRRRTFNTVTANSGNPLVGNYAVISADPDFPFELREDSQINGDLGTNSTVNLRENSTVCGDIFAAKLPIDRSVNSTYNTGPDAGSCIQYFTYNNNNGARTIPPPGKYVLGSVEPGCVMTTCNDAENGATRIPDSCFLDNNRNTRTLDLGTDSDCVNLTVSGNNYGFCGIRLRNSGRLSIGFRLPGAAPLRIYIDKPENCTSALTGANASLRGNLTMGQQAKISNSNADPSTLTIFMVGSPNYTTTADLGQQSGSTSNTAMVLYAPYSVCTFGQGVSIRGAVACWRVTLRQTATITWDPSIGLLTDTDVVPLYRRTSYVECDKISNPSPPDASCA